MRFIFVAILAGMLIMIMGCSSQELETAPLLYGDIYQEADYVTEYSLIPVHLPQGNIDIYVIGEDSFSTQVIEMPDAPKAIIQVPVITPQEAEAMMAGENVVILDVRMQYEFDAGHIKNAVLLPLPELVERVGSIIPNKDYTILIYCRSGNRSYNAAYILIEMGYTSVYDFGGIRSWHGEIVR